MNPRRRNSSSVKPLRRLNLLLFAALVSYPVNAQMRIDVLVNGDITDWEAESFVDNSVYQTTRKNDRHVVKATSLGTASGLIKEIEVDLTTTPYLNWTWRIDNIFDDNNERSKSGDDYPARVYVLISGGLLFWRTRAVNYVWSSNQPENTTWANAYTSNAQMLAVHSGERDIGLWIKEKRNVRDDLQRLFGEDITTIHGVAIMTDSDNTKQEAAAYYGEIFFSDE